MNQILLVEDNAVIGKGLVYLLKQEGFGVTHCKNQAEAIAAIDAKTFDLAVLDVMLPDGSGFAICKEIKESVPDLPVIFLTAKDEERDVVYGFDLGADDYVIKPFRSRELLSRINNVLRRYHKHEREIVLGEVKIDLLGNRVLKGESEVSLSPLEYRILVMLAQNRGRTLTRDQILGKIWDIAGNVVEDNTLTVYIRRIRNKLGENVIETVKGIGYRIDKEA
ncbi:MAG: response regulator transcription factor [Lachnospiraceae bacterium]|nr:response regulator transcription factor [Lachnospiraceae bacterium]